MTGPLRQRLRRRLRRYRTRVRSVPHKQGQPGVPVEIPGVVNHLGPRAIRGWVEVEPKAPVQRIGLYVDDDEVATVAALPSANRLATDRQIRTFNFTVADLWHYTNSDSRVSVRVKGRPLPLAGRGMFYRPRTDGEHTLRELREQRAQGWLFASDGKLRLDKNRDHTWQRAVMDLYRRVYDVVHAGAGYETFLIYGSLLGAVRDNGFIGHDFDVDTAYLSAASSGAEAAAEIVDIGYRLLEAGLAVEARVVCLHVYDPTDRDARIDLFHLYFHPDTGVLRFAWGLAGHRLVRREMWQGLEAVPFAGTTVRIPRNAEQLVAAIYGPTWRIPNAGFTWAGNRNQMAVEARIDLEVGDRLNWDSYYAYADPRGPSGFVRQLLDGDDLPHAVLDLGCGDGRDALALASRGHAVLGVDLSRRAIEGAERRARDLPEAERPAFANVDLGSAAALGEAIAQARHGDRPLLFYGRFLLHALREDAERTFVDTLYGAARGGDRVAFEFRTVEDEKRPKSRWLPYRHYIDAAAVHDELAAHGFDDISIQQGTGLATLEDEDPHIARIVATRTG